MIILFPIKHFSRESGFYRTDRFWVDRKIPISKYCWLTDIFIRFLTVQKIIHVRYSVYLVLFILFYWSFTRFQPIFNASKENSDKNSNRPQLEICGLNFGRLATVILFQLVPAAGGGVPGGVQPVLPGPGGGPHGVAGLQPRPPRPSRPLRPGPPGLLLRPSSFRAYWRSQPAAAPVQGSHPSRHGKEKTTEKTNYLVSSVADPDPVGSETFCRIRKKSFRIRAARTRNGNETKLLW